ncbi:amino acid adenylation domain-containing protein [Streptomyces sp. NPDC049813]|uniref:amino acid adenylation domain-containing protein n=1 Tax=Streptomyces sp. NPDC049813 TaxID=3365597 RepID=UPI0037B1BDB2
MQPSGLAPASVTHASFLGVARCFHRADSRVMSDRCPRTCLDVAGSEQGVRAVGRVQDLVAEWVERCPARCAVRVPATGESLSYRELWDLSQGLAGDLVAAGIGPGDAVPVAVDRSLELVPAFLGVLLAGAAYVPLDAMAPEARLRGILDEVGAELVVTYGPGSRREPWASLPDGTRRVPVPTTAAPGAVVADPVASDAEAPAYISYTSGSTGRPKGVIVPHRGVLRLVRDPVFCTIGPGDRVANTCNPAFDVTTFEIWNTLTAGATLVVLPSVVTDLSLEAWARMVRSEGIDTMFLTTSLFHTVGRERPETFGGLRTLITAGEQLELGIVRDVLAAAAPGRLVNAYGPTEATTFASSFDCTPDSLAGRDRVPIGRPIQQTTLKVVADDLSEAAHGEVGELCIGGPGVALGYLGRPELTAERFVVDGATGETHYRSGDLCRVLPDGTIEYLGRADRQVKLRGFRVELPEIERAAAATGLVSAAFVEKVGTGTSAMLVGFALPSTAGPSEPDDLREALGGALADRLPSYMLPGRWVVVERLPLGSTGKVDRTALLRLLDVDAGAGDDPVLARPGEPGGDDTLLVELARLWREVLGAGEVAAGDNFLELGGDSVRAMQLVSRIDQRYGVPVEPGTVLLLDSLAELAEHVRQLGAVAA